MEKNIVNSPMSPISGTMVKSPAFPYRFLTLLNLMTVQITRSWSFCQRAVAYSIASPSSLLHPKQSALNRRRRLLSLTPFQGRNYFHQIPPSAIPFAAMSSSAASSSASSSSIALMKKILGGDHAGLIATFSSSSGELIPVPEHLVPQSMIDWGDIPSYLEVLTSEDFSFDGEEEDFMRTTVTVLPEVGCGIDNLETTKKVDRYFLDKDSRFSYFRMNDYDRGVISIDKVNPPVSENHKRIDLETIFEMDPEMESSKSDEKSASKSEQINPRRIRLSFSIEIPNFDGDAHFTPKITTPFNLYVQRRYPSISFDSIKATNYTVSTKGTAWTGASSNSGGLDARTVMNFIGKEIAYGDVFAVKRIKNGEDCWDEKILNAMKAGCWIESVVDGNDTGKEGLDEKVDRTLSDFGMDARDGEFVMVRLPQNVSVRYGFGLDGSWKVEISQFAISTNDKLRRRVLSRSFDVSCNDRDDFSGILGYVRYSIEEQM
ncbi:hypothetical protein ACHAXS_006404 [Conticribra weissflogii]